MPRIPLIHPRTGARVLATVAGAPSLIAGGFINPNADATPAEKPLNELRRADLDKIAADLGVERPGDLPNKAAVIAAITAKREG